MTRKKGLKAPKGKASLRNDPNRTEYLAAGEKEWDGLWKNKTWHWVKRRDLPKGAKIIPTMMVYDNKLDDDGNTIGAKGRIVCLGNLQREGVDYPVFTSATVMNSRTFRACVGMNVMLDDVRM